VVDPAPIDAIDDTPAAVNGATGATIPNVVTNDTLNGVANPTIGTDVTVNETGTAQDGTTALGLDVTPAAGGISLNPANGEVTVDPGTTAGTYVYTYEICEVLNTTNCDTATVTVVLESDSLITEIEEDLTVILETDLVNTLTMQSNQISGYSADALDRLRGRNHDRCLADVNARLASENILFDTDRAIIKPASRRTLDEISTILSGCPGSAFEIAGHTDSDASDAYNLDLSQRRVEAVMRALANRGVDTAGYIARGYGESQPIASNATEAGKAQNRRVEFRALGGIDDYQGPCEDSFNLVRSINLQANDDGANADGQFLRDKHDCITDRREVFEGSLSYSDTGQGQTQSAINFSYRREQYRGNNSVFGYFVGLYGSQSDVTNRATGEIHGLGVNAGIYGAKRLQNELFLDYYLGGATGRHKFDLNFDRSVGTISATGDYTYWAGFAGAALSGELEYGETTITPRVGFDYVYTPGADVDVIAELGGLSQVGNQDLDAISGGRIFAEIRTDRLVNNGASNLWFNPRIACYQSLGSLDGVCGFGGSIGIENADEDSDLNYAFEIDGEWGSDYFLGSLKARASRQIGRGRVNGDAGLNSDGNVTMGANFEMEF
jgi:outer membrane protein OmpA-like peptidoglycan-associated protein